jgi:hypothetical protein
VKAPTRHSSTLRFVLGVVSAIVLVVVLVLWLVISNLRADIAARRERLHRAGVPMTFAELAPPPIPDEENAAPLYEEAFRLLAASNATDTFVMMEDFVAPRSGINRDALRSQVATIIRRESARLDVLVAASRRRHCRFPIAYDELSPLNFHFQYLTATKMRNLSWELHARAILESEAGDSRAAVNDCGACLRIAHHLAEGPTLNHTASKAATRTDRVLREVIDANALDVETCRVLFKAVQLTDLRPASRALLTDGVPWEMWMFDVANREPKTFLRYLKMPSARMRAGAVSYLSPFMYPVRLHEEATYLRRVEQMLALHERPYRDSARAYARMMREDARAPRYELITWLRVSEGGILCNTALARDWMLTDQGSVLVALALKAYHAKHGRYPDSLAALHEFPGWALPDDPFSGKAYGYERTGEGFRVWSWGPDLRDDRGNPGDYARSRGYAGPERKGDLVWEFRN